MTATKEAIECNVPSCSKMFRGTKQAAQQAGWRGVKLVRDAEPAEGHGRKQTGRSMLGWCPACAVKFSVEGE